MWIICNKNSKKLVKGLKYKVNGLWNSGNNQKWLEGKVEIVGFGRYVTTNFTDINGNPLPKSDIIPQPASYSKLEFSELKKGDILVCISDNYKTLIKNGMYKIDELVEKSEQKKGWNNVTYTSHDRTIKFEGIQRRLKFSHWRFRKLTPQESREISLGSLLDGEEANVIKTKDIRKIDMVLNKELELIKNLSKAIIDEGRHHLSIIDWACYKTGNGMGINQNDYESLMNMTLKDILSKIETK
jgi:hypothetical protein